MRTRRIITIACAAGIALAAAGCGGETTVETVTTDQAPDTATAATTTDAAPTTLDDPGTTEAPDAGGSDAEARLPAPGVLDGTNPGSVVDMPDAEDMTTALYAEGDPARIPAAEALDDAGYAGGALRDDTGTDPQEGVALFRTYVMELGDAEAAEAEVVRSVQEVLATTQLDTTSFPVPDIPGASGVSAQGSQGGVDLAVMFIAFPADGHVYGFQVVAQDRDAIDADRVLEIAQEQYRDAS